MTRLLKVHEAAERLAISQKHLRRLIAQGRLRAVRLGRAVRVPEAELERLADGRQADHRPGSGISCEGMGE